MPTLKGTEVSFSYAQCFLYLVPSSINDYFSYYIDVMQAILIILTMVGLFPDRTCMNVMYTYKHIFIFDIFLYNTYAYTFILTYNESNIIILYRIVSVS